MACGVLGIRPGARKMDARSILTLSRAPLAGGHPGGPRAHMDCVGGAISTPYSALEWHTRDPSDGSAGHNVLKLYVAGYASRTPHPPLDFSLSRDPPGDFTVSSLRIGTQLLNNQLILLTLITKQQTSQYAKNRSKYRTKNRDRLLYSIAWPRRARGARGPQFIITLRPPRTPPRSAMVAAAAATAASVASVARATVAAAV